MNVQVIYLFFIIQVNLIAPTKEDIAQGKDAMTIGDYGTAIQYFTKAIEVNLKYYI